MASVCARYGSDLLEAEESVTRTAECPHCGQPPGLVCRSTGPQRQARVQSHRARFRAARHLSEDYTGDGDDFRERRSVLADDPAGAPQ